MRRFRHWTPLYIKSRIEQYFFEKNNRDKPWLSSPAVVFLSQYARGEDTVLEFGSGRSTIFFAGKCHKVVSHEHDARWYEKIKKELETQNLGNADYHLYEDQRYWRSVNEYLDESFDIVLIDGLYRVDTTLVALPKLRRGGIMLIDDIQRYVPSQSRSPYAKRSYDPENTEDRKWMKICEQVKGFRFYWASDNVKDTLVIFKPLE